MNGPPAHADQLDLQVDNAFVDWGAFDAGHEYSYSTTLGTPGTVSFRVFDGDAATSTPNAAWYADNNGSLTVDIYRVP